MIGQHLVLYTAIISKNACAVLTFNVFTILYSTGSMVTPSYTFSHKTINHLLYVLSSWSLHVDACFYMYSFISPCLWQLVTTNLKFNLQPPCSYIFEFLILSWKCDLPKFTTWVWLFLVLIIYLLDCESFPWLRRLKACWTIRWFPLQEVCRKTHFLY